MNHTQSKRWAPKLIAAAATAGLVLAGTLSGSAWAVAAPTVAPAAASGMPAAGSTPSVPDTLAAKPYMGWSSYSMQVYSGNSKWITGDQLVAQSDAMHEKLQDFGYDYINVDAGWADGVDEYARPTPSKALYPDGMQKVIDHVHANGQKFGLYMIPGISPEIYNKALPIFDAPGCTTHDIVRQPIQQADYWKIGYRLDFDNPCTQKYVNSIANLFGEWGINFLKFDSVTPGSGISDLSLDARDDVAAWSKALKPHNIWFELSWALDINYADYWKQHANGWRVEWDVECYCENEALTQWDNIARLIPRAADWWRHAGPGGWNDFDSLNVGNGSMDGLTREERRTATTLWAISAAPMYIGNDMTKLDSFGLDLLTNREVVAVNQAGTPAQPVSLSTKRQTWYALNADGSYTVALFNLGKTEADVTARWSDIGIAGTADVRDLWAGKNLGRFDTEFAAEGVPVHGVRLLKVTPDKGADVSVNDDTLRVSYDGAWSRNGNNEVAAAAQPLTVSVVESDTGAEPTAPPASPGLVLNDNDPAIVYTGQWGQGTNRGLGDYQDDVHYTEANGASFQYNFQGTGITYVTEMDESQGDVDVYVDGEFKQTVSTHRDAGQGRAVQQAVYSVAGLGNGAHTLRVVKKSGGYMLLDKLEVTLESMLSSNTAAFDRSAPAAVSVDVLRDPGELASVSYDGKELTRDEDYVLSGKTVSVAAAYLATLPVGDAALSFQFRGDYQDDVHFTKADGDSVSFTFEGTGVTWVTAIGPDQGAVDAYIDGAKVKRVDMHNDTRVTGREVFSVGKLKSGKHTFKAVKVSGDIMRNDVIRYTRS